MQVWRRLDLHDAEQRWQLHPVADASDECGAARKQQRRRGSEPDIAEADRERASTQEIAERPFERPREDDATDDGARTPSGQQQAEAAVAGVKRLFRIGELDRSAGLEEDERDHLGEQAAAAARASR